MIHEGVRAAGLVSIYDASGALVHSSNTVLTFGKEWIAQRCTGEVSSLVTHIALGSDAAPVVVGDTGLKAEVGRVPVIAPGAVTPANRAVIRYEAVFARGVCVGALTEAGLFTAASAGTCVARTVFPVKDKGPYDIFTVVWEITII